jgi:hypothetical protein
MEGKHKSFFKRSSKGVNLPCPFRSQKDGSMAISPVINMIDGKRWYNPDAFQVTNYFKLPFNLKMMR